MNTNLTLAQKDYAHFLPAISGFYATFIGKQRREEYVDPTRIPNHIGTMEAMNWLNRQEGLFQYKWSLYSAGHADLDITKDSPKEDMVRDRDRDNTWLLGDSGGFQIYKGIWPGDWDDPHCPNAAKKRKLVLDWLEEYMDYGMMLDIPTFVYMDPETAAASGIHSHRDAVEATHINARYYMANRKGRCKILNVLQGSTHADADDWYEEFKDYCDPKKYPDTYFNGWAMGAQNMCDIHLALKRIIALRFDGLLEKGLHDVMHFLGTSKLEWAALLTDVQRAIRKYHNENFMITFDCASPFLATANGQIYCSTELPDRKKWVYRMTPGIDDKRLHQDTTPFGDAFIQEGCYHTFQNSPISDGLTAADICKYGPTDTNKNGKIGKTSWDSFSYALQMGHNVWMHINAVQEANRQYDTGIIPNMLIREMFDKTAFRDVVNDIFATDDRDKANMINDDYQRYLDSIIGTRGATGKKMTNSKTYFNKLFDVA